MYKSITPGLITFDTSLKKLPGSYYSDNFDSYSETKKKGRFHYRLLLNNNIKIPQKYDYKDAYFIKSKNKWYYERKLGPVNLKFCFNPAKNIFSFNYTYTVIPFLIGDVCPIGLLISDFINLDLFLVGITTLKGCAYNLNQKNICLMAPSNNGKTRLIEKVLRNGGKYITEDILIMDLQNKIVYPNTIRSNIFAKKADRWLRNLQNEKLITKPQRIDNMYLVQNSTSKDYSSKNKSIYQFFHSWRVPFNINPLLRSFVFEEGLRSDVDHRLSDLNKSQYIYKHIKEFNYDFLNINK